VVITLVRMSAVGQEEGMRPVKVCSMSAKSSPLWDQQRLSHCQGQPAFSALTLSVGCPDEHPAVKIE